MHPFVIVPVTEQSSIFMTPCPGTKESSVKEALATLKAAGTKAVVTMMPNSELQRFNADSIPSECAALGMQWFHIPAEDDSEPEAAFELAFAEHKVQLLKLLEGPGAIAIHCRGGTGRTGMLAASLMLEKGMAWPEVKKRIQQVKPTALTLNVHLTHLENHYNIER